jgi:cell division protein YceG involved in septum cleavage
MSRYHIRIGKSPKARRLPRRILWLLLIVAVLCAIGSLIVRHKYDLALLPVNSNQTTVLFTVAEGSSVKQIADQLQQQHLIRSAWALELYVHSQDSGNE